MSYDDINIVVVQGKLVHDPVTRYLPNGTAVCNFSIANNRSEKGPSGAWTSVASYFDIAIFGKEAEALGTHKKKGDPVLVNGRLKQHRWEEEGSGKKKNRVGIIATHVEWLPRNSKPETRNPEPGVPPEVKDVFNGAEVHEPIDEGDIPF